MSESKKKLTRARRRAFRSRAALASKMPRMRISVFRSLQHIYAQVIDDTTQKTLASSSSRALEKISGDKKAVAKAVGTTLAGQIKKLGLDMVVFDRGPFLYHGRVQALADGLREGGVLI